MSRRCLGLALLLAAPACADAASNMAFRTIPGVSPVPKASGGVSDPRELESFLDGVLKVQLKDQNIPGAVIVVVKDGKPIVSKGYGFANLEEKTPADASTSSFRPGSTSKLVSWTAVMQLYERGLVDLDADVNKYLTQFQLPTTYQAPVTLRNLMTHSAGFEEGGLFGLATPEPSMLAPAEFLKAHMPARVREPTTRFDEGIRGSYSNWGAALAGLIVANVAKMSFDEYVRTNIFDPLGMKDSTFAEPVPGPQARVAVGYTFEGGTFKKHQFEYLHNWGPAGSMSSTATDMGRFVAAQLQSGDPERAPILKPQTFDLMQARSLSPHPNVNGGCLGFVETYINGHRLVGHGGDTLFFHSDLQLIPEAKIGYFVSFNGPGGVLARRQLLRAFMDHYYPARLPDIRAPPDFQSRAGRYVGTYRWFRQPFTTNDKVLFMGADISVDLAENNALTISGLLEAKPSQWIEVGDGVFRNVKDERVIAFVEDSISGGTNLVGPFAFMASRRIPWYQTSVVHEAVLGVGVICFIVSIVSWIRNRKKESTIDGQRARKVASATGLLGLLFVGSFVVALVQLSTDPTKGVPLALYVSLAFPLAAMPMAAGQLLYAARAWQGKWGTWYDRCQYSVTTMASVAFLCSLNFWNLLGYKFF